jgi:hypothetical protein
MMLPGAGPHAEYERRLADFQARHADLQGRLAWLGNGRFALFIFCAIVFFLAIFVRIISPWWLAPSLAVYFALSVSYQLAYRRYVYVRRAMAYYEYGLARLDDRWAGTGIPGTHLLDEQHPYAADLDLFGPGSLYERLCDARTRVGRETLARWLAAPAPVSEIHERQAAVADLRDRLSWREHLALLGADVPEGIDTATFATWGSALTGPASPAWPLWVARVLVVITLVTLLNAVFGWSEHLPGSLFFGAALLAQGAFAQWLKPRVRRALAGLHGRSRELFQLTGMLRLIEGETFNAPELVRLRTSLEDAHETPSRRLARLVYLIELLDSTRNFYFAVIAPFLMWTTQVALAIETWRRRTGPLLPHWVEVIGELEALNALAGFAYENPTDPFPDVVPDGPLFEATGLGHPLLSRGKCVTNDVRLNTELRLLVVSGSNMSGKSTFLRTVGINTVLALAGAPVRATRLQVSPLAIGATLRVQDSLQAGKSRFYAEITRLRQIVELARQSMPVLFLLDEILHGTNSHDRRIGAEAVVRTLLQTPSIGMVTTHDLALTRLADDLAPAATNVHFADEMVNGELHFDYRLHLGVVQHSNALALMRAVGLQVEG